MKKRVSAYLTVYLALILGVLVSLSLALIEGVRLNTSQLEMVLVSDIAGDCVLAEYHRELFHRFNILAIDTSYGNTVYGRARLKERLEYYLNENLSAAFGAKLQGLGVYKDLLGIRLQDVTLTGLTVLSDEKGTVFRQQAVEALKDDLGMTNVQEIAKWLDTVEKYQLDTRDVEAEKRAIDEKIASYQGKEIAVSEEEIEVLDFEDPTVTVENRKKTGIVKQTIGDKELSGKKLNQSVLVAQRIKDGRALKGSYGAKAQSAAADIAERAAFVEYLMRYLGCFLQQSQGSALDYELEYIIVGKDADADNLKGVLHRLLAMREAANATYLFADKEKSGQAETAALAVSVVLLVPELKDAFKTAILLGWAYAESVYDLRTLLDGGRIPLIKDKNTWHYSLTNILEDAWDDFVNGQTKKDKNEGLDYQDYLRILLLLCGEEDMTMRAMNMVEADIRQTEGNKAFRLDGCLVGFAFRTVIESDYGYRLGYTEEKHY